MEADTEYRTDNALTERELALLRKYLQKGKSIMTALKVVFTLSMMGFVVLVLFLESGTLESTKIAAAGVIPMVFFFTVLFCFCCRAIDKRQRAFGESLNGGSYEVRLTTVLMRGSRWQDNGNWRNKVRVDYYKCDKIAVEVVPVSKEQFDRAFPGAPIKVVKLHTGGLYGILSEEEHW